MKKVLSLSLLILLGACSAQGSDNIGGGGGSNDSNTKGKFILKAQSYKMFWVDRSTIPSVLTDTNLVIEKDGSFVDPATLNRYELDEVIDENSAYYRTYRKYPDNSTQALYYYFFIQTDEASSKTGIFLGCFKNFYLSDQPSSPIIIADNVSLWKAYDAKLWGKGNYSPKKCTLLTSTK